jgi:hypothetical protein
MDFQASPSWSRAIFTGALVLAPLLVLLSAVGFILEGEGDNHGEIAGAIQVWGFIAFALVVVKLTGKLTAFAPRAALLLLVVGCMGVAGGVGYGIDAIQADVFDNDSIQDTTSAAAPLALQIPGGLFPLSLLAIAVMLGISKAVPAPAAGLLGVGAILFPLGNIPDIESLTVAANAVLTLAGVVLAITIDREMPARHATAASRPASTPA